jgi:recombination protein RecA
MAPRKKKVNPDDFNNPLDLLKAKIEKASKGIHVSILSDSEIATIKDNLPTPAYDLNRIISGSLFKGLPEKTLSLFVGPEASGKSSFMCLCLAEAQRKGYSIVVIDTEGAWTTDFVKRWGLDAENMLYIYTPWVDQVCITLGQIIDSDVKKIALVVDSVGAMDRMKLVDDSVDGEVKADQGTLQKEIKRMLKMILNIVKGKDSLGMCSGHYYGNPGQYGAAEKVGGGKYMQLAPDIIISLKKNKMLEGTGKTAKIIGNTVNAITLKNRYYPPFNEAVVEIDYKKGVNKCAGLMDIALELGIIEKGGSWYTFKATSEKVQGMEAALKLLEKDMESIKKIDEWLANTGYSTINENVMEATKILEESDVEEDEEDITDPFEPDEPDDVPTGKITSKVILKK